MNHEKNMRDRSTSKRILAVSLALASGLAGVVGIVAAQAQESTTTNPYYSTTTTTTETATSTLNIQNNALVAPVVLPTTTPSTISATSPLTVSADVPTNTPAPVVLETDLEGNTLLRGVVRAIGSNSLIIQSWGGTWVVRISSSATVEPTGAFANDISQISVGDFVGVMGVMARDQILTVDGTFIRDWTKAPPVETTTISARDQSIPSSEGGANTTTETSVTKTNLNLYTGSASNIGDTTFTLTDANGTVYTVNILPDTTLWNEARETISLSNIEENHSIRINGTLDGSTITATVVRDISI